MNLKEQSMTRRWLRLEVLVFFAVWLGLLAAGRSRFFEDPGTFWHTVVGEQTLAAGRVTDHDTFSFTRNGQPWAVHQWLGECCMALAHRISGMDGLLLGAVTLLAALYAWLAGLLVRTGMHVAWAAVVVALAVGVGSAHFHVRPHLASIVFQAITVWLLAQCEVGHMPVRRLFWLVPLFVLWTNLHGGVLGGIATVGLAAGGWVLCRALKWEGPLKDRWSFLAVLALVPACALTIFVNPFGTEVPRTWLEIMRSDLLPRAIQEHAPLDWTSPSAWLVAGLAGICLYFLIGTWPKRPRVVWLLPLAWAFLACERVRHAPLFAVTAVVVLADVFPLSRWRQRFAAGGSPPSAGGWRLALVPACAVAVALLLQVFAVPVPLIGRGWARLDPDHWPVALLPELRQHQGDGKEGTPIFNEYALGGFLIYNTPGYRVFIDDRCEVYGDAYLGEYVAGEQRDTDDFLGRCNRRYRFDYALTWRGSRFDIHYGSAPGWVLLGETRSVRFYRRDPSSVATAR
jgi:hypothetical protein